MNSNSLIKDYELLKSQNPVTRKEIFINELLKANIEWDLDSITSCRKSILKAIDNLVINSETFYILFRLSVFAGVFDELLKVVDDEVLEINSSNTLNETFKRYYLFKTKGSKFLVSDLFDNYEQGEDKSIVLFLLSTVVVENKNDFLVAAFSEYQKNISAIKALNKANYKLDIKTLNYLYKYDEALFYEEDFIWNKSKENYNFSFLPLGGGDTIGGSSYILNLEENKVIVDCGVKFIDEMVAYPPYEDYLDEIHSIELCIVTHAHLDHCGAILRLFKLNTSMRFLMTKETKELLKINIGSLESEEESKYLIDDLCKNILLLDYNTPYNWRKSNLTIELFRAGHILGASSILLKTPELKVFLTGDYCIEDQMTVKGLDIPSNEKVDIIITENTYGNKKTEDNMSKAMVYEKFKSYLIDEIEKGKNILIPAFAIGRSQELISYLKDISNEHGFRVYVDGASVEVSETYSKFGYDLKDRNIHYVNNYLYNSKEDFINQEFINNKSCVITSSGMLKEGSTSAVYAKKLLKSSKATCILTGYQGDNSLGSKLREQFKLNSDRYIQIDTETIKINCSFNEFHISAHCVNSEILALISKLKPTKVILAHGEAAKDKSQIHKILEKNNYIDVIQSRDNELIRI